MIRCLTTIITLAFVLLIVACGGKNQQSAGTNTIDLLPGNIDSLGITRISEPRLYVGDSLWEYIDGGAELYHAHNFVDVATADYICDSIELTIDIYSFENSDDAFGLYSVLRPPEASIVNIGIEGFVTINTLDFVKGRYLVRLVGFDESRKTRDAIDKFAPVLNNLVPESANGS